MTVLDVYRTPDERFAGIDFPAPSYHETSDGLRIAYVDTGPADAPAVWFMHGEPTWSYLWHDVIPPVRDAGFRCIAPDLVGFGRSDKPTDLAWYSYDQHVAAMASLLTALDLRDATLVVHDWGGPVGLRLAVEEPAAFGRLVIMDTGLFTGHQKMTDAWQAFRSFVERTEDLPVGFLVQGACKRELSDAEVAAYDAPFPTPASKAGARAFPLMIPRSPDEPGATEGQTVLNALKEDTRPTLMLWAAEDPIIPPATGLRFAQAIGRAEPEIVPDASHFLQEDQGAMIGARIAEFLTKG
ncbi:MAG TPA: haloalkane dehalogenase [Solirubrobacteraceae bacterium]